MRLAGLLLLIGCAADAQWKFAVSGDSRNCGDIVMPAIAAGVRASGAEFYWHLGDFRAIYTFDEDLVPPAKLGLASKALNIIDYETSAWPDFIERQIRPFGDVPVYLAPGNHEAIPPATREKYLIQFADWLDAPALKAQRLKDDPRDHALHAYYHWVERGIDFISLDNATTDQFDAAQMKWLRSVIERDEASAEIKTIVVGMHEALPGSLADSHSMSDSAQGQKSGREAYEMLWRAQSVSHKRVYVLASHSHFYMPDVYRSEAWKGKVLPGWIVGTAGAVRYRLPKGAPAAAKTDVYGYMVATVAEDGAVEFSFVELDITNLIKTDQGTHPEALIRWCQSENRQ